MQDILPEVIQRDTLQVGQARYRLPIRNLGWISFVGRALVIGGIGVLALLLWLGFQSALNAPQAGPHLVFKLVSLLPGLSGAVLMLTVGFALARSRTEIEITRDELCAVDWLGPIRLRRQWPLERVRQFSLATHTAKRTGAPIDSGPLAGFGALCVDVGAKKPAVVAWAYPLGWLKPLAEELSRCAQRTTGRQIEVKQSPISLLNPEEAPYVQTDDTIEQPAGSNVVMESHDDGLTFHIPPAGLIRGSGGLFLFALLWLGFMVPFSAVWFLAEDRQAADLVPISMFLLVFWSVGIGMLVTAIHLGRRMAVIAVAGESLMVLRKGIFGASTHEWPREALSEIRVEPSGVVVNNKPLFQLRFYFTDGHKFAMLIGRDIGELRWIATHLRLALDLSMTAETIAH